MAYLNDFSVEERLRVVSLPVRLGYHISHADDAAHTMRDDEREHLSLQKALESILKNAGRGGFVSDVAAGVLASRGDWDTWEQSAGSALDDVPSVLALIDSRLPAEPGRTYRKMLYFLSAVVAQAASEDGGVDDLRKEVMGGGLLMRLMDRLSVRTDLKLPQNISKKEREALQKLRQYLKG